MQNSLWIKGLVIINVLFIVLSSLPNIGGISDNNINSENTFILSKNHHIYSTIMEKITKQNMYNNQKQSLGIFNRWIILAEIHILIYYNCSFIYTLKGENFYHVSISIMKSENLSEPVCSISCSPYFSWPVEKDYYKFFKCKIVCLNHARTTLTTPIDPDGGYIEGTAILLRISR